MRDGNGNGSGGGGHGKRNGETDLRELQRHVAEREILVARARWLELILPDRKDRKWMYVDDTPAPTLYRPMTPLAFQVMVNETLRHRRRRQHPTTWRWRGE